MSKMRRGLGKSKQLPPIVKSAPAAPKAGPQEEMVLQFGESEITAADISGKVKEDYSRNGNEEEIKLVKIYVKPEDNKAYYVINDTVQGDVDLF